MGTGSTCGYLMASHRMRRRGFLSGGLVLPVMAGSRLDSGHSRASHAIHRHSLGVHRSTLSRLLSKRRETAFRTTLSRALVNLDCQTGKGARPVRDARRAASLGSQFRLEAGDFRLEFLDCLSLGLGLGFRLGDDGGHHPESRRLSAQIGRVRGHPLLIRVFDE